jgi:small subunit ribosomal protein S16
MAVAIRLARHGTKKTPFYRVVVTDQRMPRNGRHLENIGTFDPQGVLKVDGGRLEYWQSKGAQPSHTLDRLLKQQKRAAAKS